MLSAISSAFECERISLQTDLDFWIWFPVQRADVILPNNFFIPSILVPGHQSPPSWERRDIHTPRTQRSIPLCQLIPPSQTRRNESLRNPYDHQTSLLVEILNTYSLLVLSNATLSSGLCNCNLLFFCRSDTNPTEASLAPLSASTHQLLQQCPHLTCLLMATWTPDQSCEGVP